MDLIRRVAQAACLDRLSFSYSSMILWLTGLIHWRQGRGPVNQASFDHCPSAYIIPSHKDPVDSSPPQVSPVAIVIQVKKVVADTSQGNRRERRKNRALLFLSPSQVGKSPGVTTDESSHDHANKKRRTEFLKDIKRRSVLSERKKELNNLETTATATTTRTASATSGPATAPAAAVCLLAGLVLGLGGVIHEQGVERQAVGEDVITDCRTTNVDGIQRNGVAALGGHLDGAEGGVHLRGDRCDGAVENCACRSGFVSVGADVGSEIRGMSRD